MADRKSRLFTLDKMIITLEKGGGAVNLAYDIKDIVCLLYTSPSPRDS